LVRAGCEENCRDFAIECKKQGVRIVCGSDAHISFDVGRFDRIYKLLDEVLMPEELIMNTSTDKFHEYFKQRRKRINTR